MEEKHLKGNAIEIIENETAEEMMVIMRIYVFRNKIKRTYARQSRGTLAIQVQEDQARIEPHLLRNKRLIQHPQHPHLLIRRNSPCRNILHIQNSRRRANISRQMRLMQL